MKNTPLPGRCPACSAHKPTGNKDDREVKEITSVLSSTKLGFTQKELGRLKRAGKGAQGGRAVELGVPEHHRLGALGASGTPPGFGGVKCRSILVVSLRISTYW